MDETTLRLILDALPFPIVFVDTTHTIRLMNKRARFHYYEERGYRDLIGKSIFDCHNQTSKERILKIIETLKNHGREVFLTVTNKNERLYVTPVRDDAGELIGYFERFEGNYQK
ncbi:MAG TPA: PAS domain-containing protein [Syntrophorhabdales bacterium]|nr:PAS domain-containing protein [Syntrophorhabdales bacterium]